MSSPADATLRRRAWAKVNLTLHVTGRRADGYHEIDSLIVFAGVGDELEFAIAADLSLSVTGPFAAPLAAAADDVAEKNLVLRAAEALRARAGISAGARIRLHKRLPVAAGIGGGSADAAAALSALAAFWQIPDPTVLPEIARTLGADVPVCLAGRPSFVAGIGERISPAPMLPTAWMVLANPGRPLATATVFAARQGLFSPPRRWNDPLADAATLAAWLAECSNDLEAAARGLAPEIGTVLAVLSASKGCLLARMSGSGATCFGLYGDSGSARAAAAAIHADRPAWWVVAAPLLGADENDLEAGA